MNIPSYLAALIEKGSILIDGSAADSRMIRYTTSDYPAEVGADLVIGDIEDFRLMAEMAEPRLKPWLLKACNVFDFQLASKSSEGGKMLGRLQDDRPFKNNPQAKIDPMDTINYTESKREGPGHNYDN